MLLGRRLSKTKPHSVASTRQGAAFGRSLRRRSVRNERGAAVVEAALIAPLFLLLIFGIIEVGAFLFTASSVRTAARDAARDVSASASLPNADLAGILKARPDLTAVQVKYIIVYKADTIDSPVPTECIQEAEIGGSGKKDKCNVYDALKIKSADITNFGANTPTNCKVPHNPPKPACSFWDNNWPSTSRRDSVSENDLPDLVGVYVSVRYNGLTGIVPTQSLSGQSIFQIEPQRTTDV
jgi:Flp pilus assembly pilin Flp